MLYCSQIKCSKGYSSNTTSKILQTCVKGHRNQEAAQRSRPCTPQQEIRNCWQQFSYGRRCQGVDNARFLPEEPSYPTARSPVTRMSFGRSPKGQLTPSLGTIPWHQAARPLSLAVHGLHESMEIKVACLAKQSRTVFLKRRFSISHPFPHRSNQCPRGVVPRMQKITISCASMYM